MKLDSFSKIQIAVFGIQYMANSMNCLSRGIEETGAKVPDPFYAHLQTMSDSLSKIYEEAADLLNNHDAICLLDANVLSVPSDVLLFDKDETETDYYSRPLAADVVEDVIIFSVNYDRYGVDRHGRVYHALEVPGQATVFTTVSEETQQIVKPLYDRFVQSRK